jgi:hypothetical protein
LRFHCGSAPSEPARWRILVGDDAHRLDDLVRYNLILTGGVPVWG